MKIRTVVLALWSWWMPPMVATFGQAADGVTTYRATHGMTRVACVEVNRVYGSEHPGVGTIVAVKAAPIVATWVVGYFAKKNPGSRALKVISWATGSGVSTAGVVPAVQNIVNCGW